jgi:hypothetical protein
MKTKLLLSLTALAAGLLTGGCTREDLAPQEIAKPERTATASSSSDFGGQTEFSRYDFVASVKKSLETKTVGYSMNLTENSKWHLMSAVLDGGQAVAGGEIFHHMVRMETAQLSSTLTAVALLKAIEGKPGLGVDSPVHPYLPSDWTLGPNAKLITFRHLLTHRSGLAPELAGLAEPETDLYENLKLIIAKGVSKEQVTKVNGKATLTAAKRELTANYALMRILIPYLANGAAYYKSSEQMNRNAEATVRDYVKFITEKMFYPSGVKPMPEEYYTTPDVFPIHYDLIPGNTHQFVRYYQLGNVSNWWEQDHQGRRYAGATRWYMSTQEYAYVMVNLWNGGILSAASLELLKNEAITLSAVSGKYGTYFYNLGGMARKGAGFATAFMLFPNGYVAVVHINALGGLPNNAQGYPDLHKVLQQAYEDAMVTVALR